MARSLLLILAFTLLPIEALCAPTIAPHVQVELLSEHASIQPGHDAALGLRFVMEDGWHVYWRNPGDSGEPPSVEWTLPRGFAAGAIEWPQPRRIPVGPLVNFGYDGSTLLLVPLRVPSDVAGASSVEIGAQARWLVCNEDECVPGRASLALTLPVLDAPPEPSSSAQLFAAARLALPVAMPAGWRLTAKATAKGITLEGHTLDGHGSGSLVKVPDIPIDFMFDPPAFFPFEREVIEHAAPQKMHDTDDGFELSIVPWSGAATVPRSLDGIFTIGFGTYDVSVPVVPAAADVALRPFLLAFAGGLLLNLMPCVFPVLAFKALALVGLAGESRRHVRAHGLIYALGVLVSFWALAAALLAVRAGGAQLGWGFQLQSPVVIALLASLFFWMALVLLGVSSIGGSLMGVGNRLTAGGGLRAAFYTGVLATVVATPCTAPFMGTALGYALLQPPAVALGVFTALGLGLALPYVLLTFVPSLGARLPRPGRWMETLEQLLAFPLLATVVWLVWVASLQAGPEAAAVILTALVLLGLAAWTARRWHTRWARAVAAALVVVAVGVQTTIAPVDQAPRAERAALDWQPYSTARVAELVRAGKPVFIDFTAAWCVTCQVNERLALAAPAVMEKMRALGVVPVRADWTRPDADIARALQEFGRDGVPLYVLYSGRDADPPRILPQILTIDIVLTELAQLETRSDT